MADRMIFVTPDDLMRGNVIQPQMVNDLLGVSMIPMEQIQQLAEALEAEDGILTEQRLSRIVAQFVADEIRAAAAASAVQNIRPAALEQALDMIGAWRTSNAENRERFSDEAFAALRAKLPSLVREYPALLQMRKANRLRGVLGNELGTVDFISDARPVFNQSRERVEGLLAMTTMKLLYERQNGDTEELEVFVTAKQLEDLISKAQKAQKKQRALEAFFPRWIDGGID